MSTTSPRSDLRSGKDPRSRGGHRALRFTRRLHLYSGLLLMPWVLFFGVSALLFNHPLIGEPGEKRRLDPQTLSEHSNFVALDPAVAVEALVAELQASDAPGHYTLDPDFTPALTGWALFSAPGEDVHYTAIADLEGGWLGLRTIPNPTSKDTLERAPFAGTRLRAEGYRMKDVQAALEPLLDNLGVDASEPLTAHPKVAPMLRFRLIDEQGRGYNATYDLRTGVLGGRASDGPTGYGLAQLIGELHTTHHYTMYVGPQLWWVLLADLTALLLLVWAITGLVMWWQIKQLRKTGAIMLAIALLGAVLIFGAMSREIEFEGATAPRGP